MTYRLSEKAEADLVEIYVNGVNEFGALQAEAYQDKIDETIALIAENPKIARLRDETTPAVRIHPVRSHVIVYRIDDKQVVRVLRIRHSRENWPENPVGYAGST